MNKCSWCALSAEERKWMLMQTTSWSVYMADEQDYIGRCILVLNRHCGCLSELTDKEWMELKHLIDSLLKMLYLAQMDITRKWTGIRRDWGEIHSQLEIFFADRLPQ